MIQLITPSSGHYLSHIRTRTHYGCNPDNEEESTSVQRRIEVEHSSPKSLVKAQADAIRKTKSYNQVIFLPTLSATPTLSTTPTSPARSWHTLSASNTNLSPVQFAVEDYTPASPRNNSGVEEKRVRFQTAETPNGHNVVLVKANEVGLSDFQAGIFRHSVF